MTTTTIIIITIVAIAGILYALWSKLKWIILGFIPAFFIGGFIFFQLADKTYIARHPSQAPGYLSEQIIKQIDRYMPSQESEEITQFAPTPVPAAAESEVKKNWNTFATWIQAGGEKVWQMGENLFND